MNLKEMREAVQRELEHISSGPESQSLLRFAYWGLRMNSLGKKASLPNDPYQVLQASIDIVQKSHPDYEFRYDRRFF